MGRESVAVDINNVDVGSAQREALLQYTRTFVHQSVEAAIRDLRRRDFTLPNAGFVDPFTDEFANGRIRRRPPLVVVFVPARACFLTIPAEFTKTVFDERLAN